MIKSLTVTNFKGEKLYIDIWGHDNSGLYIKKISGIGPGKAKINVTDNSSVDGGIFNSARLDKRNIVLDFYLRDDEFSIETARQQTYKYFPIKKPIKLQFKTDNRNVFIEGYVESNEPDIFSEKESTQISIICPKPYFIDMVETSTFFSGIDKSFEFPFENVGLSPMIELGDIKHLAYRNIIYTGDIDTGMNMYMTFIGNVTNPKIYNLDTREFISIDSTKVYLSTGAYLQAGDEIIINTNEGNKSITLLRDGILYNILNCIDKNSSWFKLTKGNNLYGWTVDYGESKVLFNIKNRILYEGI